MGNDVSIIDHFLTVFSQYIDSGFGLISGDVGFLVATLVGIDSTLAALAWALGEDDVIQARIGNVPIASQYDIIGRSFYFDIDAHF